VLRFGDYKIDTEWIELGYLVGTYASQGFGQFGMILQQMLNATHKCSMGLGHSPQV
jgi:hypothetical protein